MKIDRAPSNHLWIFPISMRAAAQIVAVLFIAFVLKQSYSTASPNQLRWILTPTALFVELVTGRQFTFESHAGYMSDDRLFLIAASCAGVNFLITSFLMLALMQWWEARSQKVRWIFIASSLLFAYAATLIANTIRISTALYLQRNPMQIRWFDANQLHRLEGIFIYFGFLLLLYLVARPFIAKEIDPRNHTKPSCLFVDRIFPLLIYYVTTLAIPFLNGAFRQPGFWEHSLFVLAAPLLLVTPLLIIKYSIQR